MPGLPDPVTIKGLEIPNRLVMPPMAARFATETGEVTVEYDQKTDLL